VPHGKTVYYQKHMAHHLLPDMAGDWLRLLEHCFLIRHPREMLASLDEKLSRPRLEDTGLLQQVALFRRVRRESGQAPPVIDSRDVLLSPRRVLEALCARLELPFHESMLHWPPGRRATDGIWAEHWYEQVERSTGFAPYRPKTSDLPPHLVELLEPCLECYEELASHRITG
jgi:hypothetical protein